MITYRQHDKVVTRQIADETLLIPITQVGVDLQKVYLLNETAAAVWALLATPHTFDEVLARLGDSFDAPPEVLRQDVTDLLEAFANRGFVVQEPGDV